MSCSCEPAGWPKELAQIPQNPASKKSEGVKVIDEDMVKNASTYLQLPERYKAHPAVRALLLVVIIVGITVSVLAANGQLATFPQNFINFFNINGSYIGMGAAILTVVTIGAAIVIHKTIHKAKYPITEQGIGKLTGDSHWVASVYTREVKAHTKKWLGLVPYEVKAHTEPYKGYLDISTLNEDGNGKAFFYAHKEPGDHYNVSLAIIALYPLHLTAAIVYNIVRMVVVPFYIMIRMAIDSSKGAPGTSEEEALRFRWSDILDEWGKSFYRIVKAPFYGVGIMYAALYSLVDPLNGRKLGAYLEWEWNEGVTRAEGFWSVQVFGCGGPQELWEPEGWGVRGRLGRNGFYGAGCWQPMAVVEFKDGHVVPESGESLSHAVNREKGKLYRVDTHHSLEKKHKALLKQYNTSEESSKSENSSSEGEGW